MNVNFTEFMWIYNIEDLLLSRIREMYTSLIHFSPYIVHITFENVTIIKNKIRRISSCSDKKGGHKLRKVVSIRERSAVYHPGMKRRAVSLIITSFFSRVIYTLNKFSHCMSIFWLFIQQFQYVKNEQIRFHKLF